MPTYVSQNGNYEEWDKKPEGYFTVAEWEAKHPVLDSSREGWAQQRRAEILSRLEELDRSSIRSIRAALKNTATDADHKRLASIETEASNLRTELATL